MTECKIREKQRTANMGLASCGVTCLNPSAVFQINFSAGLTVLYPEIPHERQAQNRCAQAMRHLRKEINDDIIKTIKQI